MKTVVKELSYDEVIKLKKDKIKNPKKPLLFWRFLIKTLGKKDLKETNFSYKKIDMEKLGDKEPCLILMNHSCFMDLEIAESIFYPRPLNIICTSDGFVGKNWLMRQIGCIPTNKFVSDFVMVKQMKYALDRLKSSVLMYPEASYSFDGTATPLPSSLGKCLKLLNVPVIMIKTYGAFARDPLYNNLQKRKVNVSADVKYLLSKEDLQNKTADEINSILTEEFTFDNWRWQQENQVRIKENFRADYLNRVLYKCPCCTQEGQMQGKGIFLTCKKCDATWELTEQGFLRPSGAVISNRFEQVSDWFKWQRDEVRKEIERSVYKLAEDVEIYMMVNKKAIYHIGSGFLQHSNSGFVLSDSEGKFRYEQKPQSSYSLYSDYYWYKLGDMICIGDMKTLYYCFPKKSGDIVAKARIATEEMYKLYKSGELK